MEPPSPEEIGSTRDLIAGRAKEARHRIGLSQPKVADQIPGLTRGMVSEIETGRRDVSAPEALRLARLYGVSVSWLCGAPDLKESTPDLSDLTTEEIRDLRMFLDFLRYRRRQQRRASRSAP